MKCLLSLRSWAGAMDAGGSIGGDASIIMCLSAAHVGDNLEDDVRRCELLKELVRHGADVNAQGQTQKTAFMVAAEHGFLNCLQFLTASGADLTITAEDQETALTLAVKNGKNGCVKYLADRLSASMLNHKNDDEKTAPMIAASRDGLNIEALLLAAAGADVNVEGQNGYTALMFVLMDRCSETALLLLKRGASISTITSAGHTPLTMSRRDKDVLRLLHHGPDPTRSRTDRYWVHQIDCRWRYRACPARDIGKRFPAARSRLSASR